MAGDNQHFCLRWNNHQSTLISVFDTLLESGTLVDCTLAAEGQFLKAHKVVLCACSPYLEILLSQHYEKHPIVILKDIKFQELKSMMDYMYRGEVNISQDQLSTFLKAAESLQIKGLTDGGGNEDGTASSAPAKAPTAAPVRKPVQQSVPRPAAAAAQGLTIERRPESPHMRSRDDSASPTPRKRRRNQRRPSTSDDPDSHIDTSNSCDVPPLQSGAMSGVGVPNIPATITKGAPLNDGDHETETSRVNNHDASAAEGVAGPKIEPTGELIEPKTEYMEEMNNEDSIEDLTLDDDDDMDNSMDMSRAGPSHDNSNQSFGQWPMSANQTDEVFMNAQEAVGAHRDTQGDVNHVDYDADPHSTRETTDHANGVVNPVALENNEEAPNSVKLRNNEEAVNSIALEISEESVNSTALENNEKAQILPVHRNPKLWMTPVDALLTDKFKKEMPDIEYQTIFDLKDEIEDKVEEVEFKVEESELIPQPVEPPPFIKIPLPKVAIPKLHQTIANKGVKKQRIGKSRTILPMTQSIAHVSTSQLEQASTPHQIIMPSTQMSGIAYQIFLGDHSKNSNNPIQYTMLQPQPVFLQPTSTSASSASSVVMSQSPMVFNQSFPMTQAQIQPSTKVPQITPHRRITRSRRKSCSFCYKLYNDINEHLKECWLNPDSKRYKFRKIAPSTPL